MGALAQQRVAAMCLDLELDFLALDTDDRGGRRDGITHLACLRCEALMCPPTVVQPSGRWSATASMAAFSINAIIAGVASTAMSPDPITIAVTASLTVNWLLCRNPSI